MVLAHRLSMASKKRSLNWVMMRLVRDWMHKIYVLSSKLNEGAPAISECMYIISECNTLMPCNGVLIYFIYYVDDWDLYPAALPVCWRCKVAAKSLSTANIVLGAHFKNGIFSICHSLCSISSVKDTKVMQLCNVLSCVCTVIDVFKM